MNTANTTRNRNSLNAIQKAAFLGFVKDFYRSSRLNNKQFAEQASAHIGAEVHDHQVLYYCKLLGIQSNFDIRVAEKKAAKEKARQEKAEMKKARSLRTELHSEPTESHPESLRDIVVRLEQKIDRLLAVWGVKEI